MTDRNAFRIGDRVRVRRDLEPEKLRDEPPYFVAGMDASVGREGRVSYVFRDGWGIEVTVDGERYTYAADWLEPVDSAPAATLPASAPPPLDATGPGLSHDLRQALQDAISNLRDHATAYKVAELLGVRVEWRSVAMLAPA